MDNQLIIPIFPLNILPLPGELVPLHIFEQRYRDLLVDLEEQDLSFGILYVSDENPQRIGAIMKLEKVLKRYDSGESDILVKCVNSFVMIKYLKSYKEKLYAGGEVLALEGMGGEQIDDALRLEYENYLSQLKKPISEGQVTIDVIAQMVDMDNSDKLKYLSILDLDKKQKFLSSRIKYKTYILEQEQKYKNSFILN